MTGDRFDDADAATPPNGPAPGVVGGNDAAIDLGYTVTVDSFSGPLDLLLYLVRRTELDILEVPLSLIVDQFVETVRSWQDADLDVAGDFILMAATLLELKARTIAPPVDEPADGERDEPAFDPRESLLRSLLAYRRFKEAAQGLDRLEDRRRPLLERQVRESIPEAPPEEGDFDLGELDLNLLMTTCERLMARIGGRGPRTVVVDEMPLGTRIAAMLDVLASRPRLTLRDLLAGNSSRVVHITTVMATLELTRQRFVEVEQPEQFGDIALRLRTSEEREREPELPPVEPDAPRRRRRLPLVTYQAPSGNADAMANEDEQAEAATPDEPSESDEVRFLRELEEATRVSAVLAITANVEASFTAHWYALHPELVPAVAAQEVPAPSTPSTPAAGKNPFVKKTIRAPTAASAPSDAESVVEVPAAPTGDPTIPSEIDASTTTTTLAGDPTSTTTTTPAETAPNNPVAAATTLTGAVASEPPPTIAIENVVTAAAAMIAPVAVTTPEEAAPLATTDPIAEVMLTSGELVADHMSDRVVEHVVPARMEPAPTPERIIPLDEWPVMHAMPQPEESAHPLDDVTSDDPAEVNALLHGQARHDSADRADDEMKAEHQMDPDDLLGDDPALVNAALQAANERPLPEPRVRRDVSIPPPTDTTIWTAPVDLGQTVADPEALGADEGEVEASAQALTLPENPPAENPAAVTVTSHDETPIFRAADDDDVVEESTLTLATAEPFVSPRSSESDVAAEVADVDPTPALPPTAAAVTAAPLDEEGEGVMAPSDASSEPVAQAPTMVELIAVARVTTLQAESAADVEDELVSTPSVIDLVAVARITTLSAEPTAITLSEVLVEALGDNTSPTAVTPPPAVIHEVADVLTNPPDTAEVSAVALAVPPPPEVPAAPAPNVPSVPMADVTVTEPLAVEDVVEMPPPVPPPPVDGPPPPAPPPPPASDSPNAPITTTPTPTLPMSPPPRTKTWLLIALIAAINLAWAGWTWFAWVPKDVVMLIASPAPQAAAPPVLSGRPTLAWTFNLDVVDDLGVALPPAVVPRISPALSGRWYWQDRRTLAFEPATELPLATDFTAVLAADQLRTAEGFRLKQPWTDHWTTPALSLDHLAVETFDHSGTIIALTFNQPVDPLVIAQELSVELPAAEIVDRQPAAEPAPAATIDATPAVTVATPAPAASDAPVVNAEAAPASSEVAVATTSETPVAAVDAATPTASTATAASATEPAASVASETNTTAAPAAPIADSTPIAVAHVVAPEDATTTPVVPAATVAPAATMPLVRAVSTGPAATIRLLIAAPVRGLARLRLPAGTVGVAGPRGLVAPWQQSVPLQQTLVLTQASARVPSHGEVQVEVAVSDPHAPRDLLAPAVMVEPALPVTVSTTDHGLSLIGAFSPGQTYRISTGATWPDEPGTSGHVLAAYTAASSVTIAIPPRPPGLWPLDDGIVDGHLHLAAEQVSSATVTLLHGADEETVASSELTWTSPGDAPARLDLDELTAGLSVDRYRLRADAADHQTTWSQPMVIEEVRVRPHALLAAVITLGQALWAGDHVSDVPVRVVRLERTAP